MAREHTTSGDVVVRFPTVAGRDLLGREVLLPDGLDGDPRVVVLAFRRWHQRDVDSWVPWLQEQADARDGLRFYEVPAISQRWAPARRFIDGGMAAAIRDRDVLARTITFYGDLTRLTDPLGIRRQDEIRIFLLDETGQVTWTGTGGFSTAAADALGGTLDSLGGGRPAARPMPGGQDRRRVEQFEFAWNPRFRPLLAALGVSPTNAHVTVTGDRLLIRFGPWALDTPLSNVIGTELTGDYAWYKAVGVRLSLADRGVTFGTDTASGVCVCFDEPVPALLPVGSLRHPGATLTVEEPERFAAVIDARAT